MWTHAFSVLVTGFVLTAAGFFPGPAHAQSDLPKPAVLEVAAKPIGKVVVATGSVTLERATAVVVQASTSGPAGQAKVGDLVYQGDAVATGADGKVGINFTDGTSFNLSSNARMVLNEFVHDPASDVQFHLVQPDQGNLHLRRRQGRQDGRYEDRHPRRHHGHRGTTPRVKFGRWYRGFRRHRGGQEQADEKGDGPGAATRAKARPSPRSNTTHLSRYRPLRR